jgi:phosphate transport system substrate-binding protein
MKKLILIMSFALPIFVFFADAGAEELKIAVGTTALDNVFNKIAQPFEAETGIKIVFDHKGLGSDEVFRQVDKNLVEGGAGSVPFNDWIDLMKSLKYPIKNVSDFKWRTLGGDRIRFVTNKVAGVTALTDQQIRDIFSFKINNWADLGGKNMPISIGLSKNLIATEAFLVKRLLENNPIDHQRAKLFDDGEKLKDWLAKTNGAVSFVPSGFADKNLIVLETSDLKRPLTFITKGPPSPNVEKLLKFIFEKGSSYGIVR